MAGPELDVLRPALELALDVARSGRAAVPPVEPPPRLRRVLGFARPERALPTVRAVLDADAAFRRRVLGAADEAALGRVPWAFLARPDGWELEVVAAVEAVEAAVAGRAAAREEATAARRAAAAESARARAEEALAAAVDAREEASRELAAERRRRRDAEQARAASALAHEVAEQAAGRDLAAARAEAERWRAAAAAAEAEAEGVRAAVAGGASIDVPAPDREAVGRAVAAARHALDELSGALGALEALVAEAGAADDRRPGTTATGTGGGAGGDAAPPVRAPGGPPAGGGRGAAPVRRPTRLPPGLLDDADAVAAHLLRVPGVLVLVDGYNVTKQARPELPLVEQRRWLEDALDGVAARTGAGFEVVFDGALDAAPRAARATRPSAVRVDFSPAGVEADDVLLARLAAVPLGRAVVVVSDDRRVRDGAVDRGANVLAVGQLLAATRR